MKKNFIRKFFFSKYFLFFSKIDKITLYPDSNWAKILDPDPNSIYLDLQNCLKFMISRVFYKK